MVNSEDFKLSALSEWLGDYQKPLLIAGPCSAETESQVLETAIQIKKDLPNISFFRAGIWKPRTRPNSFEGVGEEGLLWLKKVKQELGFRTVVEVANREHVDLCLKHGVDALWIGARTTVSPFAVQEIADALLGKDIPVLVKNPVNPDLALWVGAIERIHAAGITKIIAVHRGFSSHEPSKFRNLPRWELPIELRRRLPQLPIICDPSHIAGDSELLETVSQMALDLGMHGIMIETHISPENAWSDAKQQITPSQLHDLYEKLIPKSEKIDEYDFKYHLDELRQRIDRLDGELLQIISARQQVSRDIGKIKKDNQVAVLQTDRWNELLDDRIHRGKEMHLNDIFVQKIFEAIHTESIRNQSDCKDEE